MPRLFSTYTSYLPLSWGVARRMVSVVVVLPISKYTLPGRGRRRGRASIYVLRGPDSIASQFPALVPLPRVCWVPSGPGSSARACPRLSSSSMSFPSLVQPTSGAGSPMISALSVTVVPLRALVLSGPF